MPPGGKTAAAESLMHKAIRWVISTLLAAVMCAPAARAEAARCFTPQALAAKPGEDIVRKSAVRIAPPPGVAGEPVAAPLRGVIRRVELPKDVKLVALTFDLCETSAEVAGYDGGIVDTLRKEGVAATFFAGGHWLATHPERARQLMADPLFEIGNHGWSHRLLSGVEPSVLRTQVLAPQGQARAAIADLHKVCPRAEVRPPALFRFPAGVCDRRALDFVNDSGLLAIEWDVVSGDPDPRQDAAAIRQGVASRVRSGSIVVLHANGRGHHTAEALPGLIAALKSRGFGFVTVSDLIARGTPVIVERCSAETAPVRRKPKPEATAAKAAPPAP
jgi:peptidoglycan/xylan/chitin deacetylase (PgdA/CDA1 family)